MQQNHKLKDQHFHSPSICFCGHYECCVLINPQAGTLIFLYIRKLGSFIWVPNFEFQYFFAFSGK